MSRENVDVVRAANEAWLRGDLAAALELAAPGIVTVQPPNQADARTYVGHEGLMQAMADWGVEVATELACVYTVEDGQITRWEMFFSEAEALEAVGPRE